MFDTVRWYRIFKQLNKLFHQEMLLSVFQGPCLTRADSAGCGCTCTVQPQLLRPGRKYARGQRGLNCDMEGLAKRYEIGSGVLTAGFSSRSSLIVIVLY